MMTQVAPQPKKEGPSLLIRGAMWIAIGALIAAAIVCVVWVLIGNQNNIVGRAFLTILLLAGFAGMAVLEASLAPKRAEWFSLASMISWIIVLLVGAAKIWTPEHFSEAAVGGGVLRFFQLVLVIAILQLALLHVRLYTPAAMRQKTTFARVLYLSTIALVVVLVVMLVFFLTFPNLFDNGYPDLYWRIVISLAILAAVGTALVPLLNVLFAPKKPQPQVTGGWPTYADGVTPLPALADGSPDWNAYYGHQAAQGYAALPAAQPDAAGVAFAAVDPFAQQAAPYGAGYAAAEVAPQAPVADAAVEAAPEAAVADAPVAEAAVAQAAPDTAPSEASPAFDAPPTFGTAAPTAPAEWADPQAVSQQGYAQPGYPAANTYAPNPYAPPSPHAQPGYAPPAYGQPAYAQPASVQPDAAAAQYPYAPPAGDAQQLPHAQPEVAFADSVAAEPAAEPAASAPELHTPPVNPGDLDDEALANEDTIEVTHRVTDGVISDVPRADPPAPQQESTPGAFPPPPPPAP